jgi:hypothetical protein
VNDCQLSGVLTAGSGSHYDISYNCQSKGGNVNLTGSPDYAPRIVYVGDGSGCSDNQFAQVNTGAVTGPQVFSTGSSRRAISSSAAAITRWTWRSRGTVVSAAGGATDLTLRNSQTLADGTIDPSRRTPRTAGFGAATGAQAMRNLPVTVRFSF